MMIPQEIYNKKQENKSYEELLKERDKRIKKILDFENETVSTEEFFASPSPKLEYQWDLIYLSELLKLIEEKYNKEKILVVLDKKRKY